MRVVCLAAVCCGMLCCAVCWPGVAAAAETKRANVLKELEALESVAAACNMTSDTALGLMAELKGVNEDLWQIEDDIRILEAAKDFGPRFIELARAVYVTNDRRASLKSDLNQLSGSALREEKSYASFS